MYQIRVRNHKNFAHFGPAIIVLEPTHCQCLNLYVEKLRPQTRPSYENVMASWNGNHMQSGAISKQQHSLWCKSGKFDNMTLVKNLSGNIICKSTSTVLRENKIGHYQEAADLMTHSLTTAEKHYHL